MNQATELWVNRNDIRDSRVETRALEPLREGCVRVAIDRFGLTANNVSYAVAGDLIGYWGFFPAPDPWGKVPVWGCGDVVASNAPGIPAGERLWGFLPMADVVDLQPGRIRDDQFTDLAAHRQELPQLYNNYRRTNAEPRFLRDMEVERCLFFPLFFTSFVLYDYLKDNGFFGARQVVIGSVSSKTGYGLAQLLFDDPEVDVRVIGITAPANIPFVESLGCCDDLLPYGTETALDAAVPTAFVDMSGNRALTAALHHHFREKLLESCMVGATHWENRGSNGLTGDGSPGAALPGAKPKFFFAPSQIAKRNREWGPGAVMLKAGEASANLSKRLRESITIEWTRDARGLRALWSEMLDNRIPPSRGKWCRCDGRRRRSDGRPSVRGFVSRPPARPQR